MNLSTGVTLFLLLGATQGVFLALLLLTRRENAAANRLLAAAMVAFAAFLLEGVLYVGDRYRNFPHLIGISQPVIYLFGPVIYLYARTVTGGPEAPRRRAVLHFLPAAAVILYLLPFYAKSGPEKTAFVQALLRDGDPLDLRIIEWGKLAHGAAYTAVTFRVLRRYRSRLEENFSTLDRINLRWLRNVLLGAMAIWVIAIAHFVVNSFGVKVLDTTTSPASMVLVVFVYAIGYLGLRQPEVFWPAVEDGSIRSPAEESPSPGSAKYRKSGLGSDRAEALQQSLVSWMDEHEPYDDPGLTLHQLAEQLSVSPHNLSEVINSHLGKSFHDFVNEYRVEAAKRRLRDPGLSHHSILAIALDSGFRSKSTFNKIFKRFTGVTPSEFRALDPSP